MEHPRHRIRSLIILLAALAATVGGLVGSLDVGVSTAGASTKAVVVKVDKNALWGKILETGSGMTLYRLVGDTKTKNTCTGECTHVWPPLLLTRGEKNAKGIAGLGTIKRDGGRQVTFKGVPLFTFIGDKAPHQVTGNVVDTWGQWWAVSALHPSAVPVEKSATPVVVTQPTTPAPGTTQPTTANTTASKSTPKSTTTTAGGGVSYGANTPAPGTTPTTTAPPTPTTTTSPKSSPPATTTTTQGVGVGY